MPWMTPVNFFSFAGISSGQPSSSWKPFLVSGWSGHLSLRVEHAVAVVVRIRAAVVVLEAVLVLGLVRALVGRVGDAVAVVVGIGAAVVVLEAVLVLGLDRALVGRVGDAVAVVVGIGAAVVVLEAVLVLGLVRALVGVADDAVLVRMSSGPAASIDLLDVLAAELLVDREQRPRSPSVGARRPSLLGGNSTRASRAQAPAVVDAVLGADAGVEHRVGVLRR